MNSSNGYFGGLEFPSLGIRPRAGECCDTYPLYYGIQYIHSGPFYLGLDGETPELHKGPAVFLTAPDSRFAYGSPAGTTREHYHVCATGPRIRSYLDSGLFPPAVRRDPPCRPVRAPHQFLSHMLELIQLARNSSTHDFAVAKFEYLLLLLGNAEFLRQETGFHHHALEELARRIMLAPEREWDFSAEAARLNVSVKHFIRLFRSRFDEPPHRYVLRQRLFKAATMLIQSGDSVKCIAWQCGFRSEFYFSRAFKKYLLSAPENYRATHRHLL